MTHPIIDELDRQRRIIGKRNFWGSLSLLLVTGVMAGIGITAPAATTTAMPGQQKTNAEGIAVNKDDIASLTTEVAQQNREIQDLKDLLQLCIEPASTRSAECRNTLAPETLQVRLRADQDRDDSDDSDNDDGSDGDSNRSTPAPRPTKTPRGTDGSGDGGSKSDDVEIPNVVGLVNDNADDVTEEIEDVTAPLTGVARSR